MKATRLKDEARKHELREDWEKAIGLYLQVLGIGELGEGDLELPLYNRIGDLYVRLGRPNDAVDYYEQAADRYAEAGLYNNAIALCNKALRYVPTRVSLLRKLGQFSASQGFLTDARRWFLEFAENSFKSGNVDEALTALEDFANTSDDPEVRVLLGRQLHQYGRTAEAVQELSRAYVVRRDAGETETAGEILTQLRSIDAALSDDRIEEAAAEAAARATGLASQALPALDGEPGSGNGSSGRDAASATIEPADDEQDAAAAGSDDTADASDDLGLAGLEATALVADDNDAEPASAALEGFETTSLDDTFATVDDDEDELAPPLPTLDDDEAEAVTAMAGDADDEDDESDFDLPILGDDEDDQEIADDRMTATLVEAGAFSLPTLDDEDAPTLDEVSAALETDGLPEFTTIDTTDAGGFDDGPDDRIVAARAHIAGSDIEGALSELASVRDDGDPETQRTAYELFAVLLEQAPDDPRVHQLRIELAELVSAAPGGDTEDDPRVGAYLEFARSLERGAGADKARAIYERVLEIDADNTDAKAALGASPAPADVQYVDLGELLGIHDDAPSGETRYFVEESEPTGDEDHDFAELLSQFKAKVAENVSEEDAHAHYDLGLAFKEMGLVDEAISEFQIALRAGDDRLKIQEELGQCFLLKGQHAIASKILLRALDTPCDDEMERIGVYYHLGRAYQELGRNDDARDAYERVMGLDIGFEDVSKRLASL